MPRTNEAHVDSRLMFSAWLHEQMTALDFHVPWHHGPPPPEPNDTAFDLAVQRYATARFDAFYSQQFQQVWAELKRLNVSAATLVTAEGQAAMADRIVREMEIADLRLRLGPKAPPTPRSSDDGQWLPRRSTLPDIIVGTLFTLEGDRGRTADALNEGTPRDRGVQRIDPDAVRNASYRFAKRCRYDCEPAIERATIMGIQAGVLEQVWKRVRARSDVRKFGACRCSDTLWQDGTLIDWYQEALEQEAYPIDKRAVIVALLSGLQDLRRIRAKKGDLDPARFAPAPAAS